MISLSIIIPAYNAGHYISNTIEKAMLIEDKIEVIVVDDGSKDNTLTLCQSLQSKYPNLKVVTQKNAGVSAARNLGLKNAQGEWVFFCDSDDWVDAVNMTHLLAIAKSNQYDMYLAAMNFVKPQPVGVVLHPVADQMFLKSEDYLSSVHFQGSSCNYLFRRQIIEENNIIFPKGVVNTEDQNFNIKYLCCSDGVYSINIPIYNYNHLNSSSASHSNKSYQWRIGPLVSALDLMSFVREHKIREDKIEWQVNRLVEYFYRDHIYGKYSSSEHQEVVNSLKKIAQDNPLVRKSYKYKMICLQPGWGMAAVKLYNRLKFGVR